MPWQLPAQLGQMLQVSLLMLMLALRGAVCCYRVSLQRFAVNNFRLVKHLCCCCCIKIVVAVAVSVVVVNVIDVVVAVFVFIFVFFCCICWQFV